MLQILAGLGILLVAGFMLLIINFIKMEVEMANQTIKRTMTLVENMDKSATSSQDWKKFKDDLATLKDELNANGLQNLDKKRKAFSLIELLFSIISDGQITSEEYETWESKFESRALFDTDALERFVTDYKKEH